MRNHTYMTKTIAKRELEHARHIRRNQRSKTGISTRTRHDEREARQWKNLNKRLDDATLVQIDWINDVVQDRISCDVHEDPTPEEQEIRRQARQEYDNNLKIGNHAQKLITMYEKGELV